MVERVAGGPYLQCRDKAVVNPPLAFEDELSGWSVTLMSENASVVACLNKRGGCQGHLYQWTQVISLWMELQVVRLLARYILRKWNVVTDQLSQSKQTVHTELSLLPRVFNDICRIVDLFVPRLNHNTESMCLFFLHLLGSSRDLRFSTVHHHQKRPKQGQVVGQSVPGSGGSSVASQGVVSRPTVSAGGGNS